MLREAPLKFTRESSARLVIRSVSEAAVLVNDQRHETSIALTANDVLGAWTDTPIDELTERHFDDVFATTPEIVLIGTGRSNVFAPRELTFAFELRGVGL